MDAPKLVNIAKFIDHERRVIHLPSKAKTMLPTLQYLTSVFENGRSYTEKEVNELIKGICLVDHMTARRALIDKGYLMRTANGSSYWLAGDIPICWRLPETQ